MTAGNRVRLVSISVLAMLLAVALGVQALSSASTRGAPEQAVSMFPANGLARERLAFVQFTAEVTEPESVPMAAQQASGTARATLRSVALAPKAYAILAVAQADTKVSSTIINAASQLNRRDLTLQSLVLQERIANQDYAGTIETLDQLLRVHPERSQEFFPALSTALAQEEAIPLFAEMLDGSSPWHAKFLTFAVRQPEVLPNLAQLRRQISFDDDELDRRLVASLAATEDIAVAESLYRHIAGSEAELVTQGVLDWRAEFPPFQWRFVDQPGFRAQRSRNGEQLEVAVRPGKGGPIALRLVGVPATPFEIRINHRIAPVERARDVRLQLTCPGNTTAFYDERFSRQGQGFRIESVPPECDFMILAINARAWSGRSALTATIDEVEIILATTGN